jgi:PDZ domain-containing protein
VLDRLVRLPSKKLFALAALLAGLLLLLGWLVPSNSYVYLPNAAEPVADKVRVPGEKPAPPPGGIYYVTVTLRRASWLERLLPFVRPDGATVVPEHVVIPEGGTAETRRQALEAEIVRSEEIASAVALRRAGFKVTVRARGTLIEAVDPKAPARDALREGDVIVRAGARRVLTTGELRAALGGLTPGDTIQLGLLRAEKPVRVTVRTMAAPDDRRRAIIGIRIAQAAKIDLPVKVKIDLGSVVGPSAGLPFALDILQELGRDVDRGYRIAATGEIEINGTVLAVGGIKQKTLGARAAGAEVFLVPAGDNAAEARRYAGNLLVIPVENFQQALQSLATLPHK